jgi:RNA polymerase sigma-32 factor
MARGTHPSDEGSTALRDYLSQLDGSRPLGAEEEHLLAVRWRIEGDRASALRLVSANLRFVVKIAFEYRSYGVRLLELIQEGNLGLLVAVERFDPGRGVRLCTYSVWWIRAYIQDYLRRQWSLVRFGTTRSEQRCFYRLRRERQRIERITGAPADPEVLAAALGIDRRALDEIEARVTRRDLSLDEPLWDSTEECRGDRIPDECLPADVALAEAELSLAIRQRLAVALERFDERERAIVEQRLLATEPVTLRRLGASFGISRERVRQLETRTCAKLRRELAPLVEG